MYRMEIDHMLSTFNLLEKRDTFSKLLSTGTKRKLSIMIALIGGSKVIKKRDYETEMWGQREGVGGEEQGGKGEEVGEGHTRALTMGSSQLVQKTQLTKTWAWIRILKECCQW